MEMCSLHLVQDFIIPSFYLPTSSKASCYKRRIIPALIQMTWKSARIHFLVFYIIITVLKCMVFVTVSHHALLFPFLQLCPEAQSYDPCSGSFPKNHINPNLHLANPALLSVTTRYHNLVNIKL